MILFIVLSFGLSIVASLDISDCKGTANFNFTQGCFDCWCDNGNSTCSNARNISPSGVICQDWSANDNGRPGLRPNSAGMMPWDLDSPVRTAGGAVPRNNYNDPYGREQVPQIQPYPNHPIPMYIRPYRRYFTGNNERFRRRAMRNKQYKTKTAGRVSERRFLPKRRTETHK